MKVLGSTEWRAFSSGCREVVHLRVHTGWKMERSEPPMFGECNITFSQIKNVLNFTR